MSRRAATPVPSAVASSARAAAARAGAATAVTSRRRAAPPSSASAELAFAFAASSAHSSKARAHEAEQLTCGPRSTAHCTALQSSMQKPSKSMSNTHTRSMAVTVSMTASMRLLSSTASRRPHWPTSSRSSWTVTSPKHVRRSASSASSSALIPCSTPFSSSSGSSESSSSSVVSGRSAVPGRAPRSRDRGRDEGSPADSASARRQHEQHRSRHSRTRPPGSTSLSAGVCQKEGTTSSDNRPRRVGPGSSGVTLLNARSVSVVVRESLVLMRSTSAFICHSHRSRRRE